MTDAPQAESATHGSGTPRTVGLVGGTGPAGRAVALRLAAAGYETHVGSRDPDRAAAIVAELEEAWPARGLSLRGVGNADAARADLVVMAAPWEGVLALAPDLADPLADTVVVSMANALAKVGGDFLPLTLPQGSVATALQSLLPRSRVTGAFHHLPAAHLADLDHPLDADVMVFGDDPGARRATMDLVDAVDGLRAVDVGRTTSAAAVEALTAVLVQVNVTYRTHSAIRVLGSLDRS